MSPTSGVAAVTTIQFTDSGSSTPNPGDSLTYTWDFGDGTTPQVGGATMSYVYIVQGTFYPKLTVTDTHGDAAVVLPSAVSITYNPVAAPPHADFSVDTNNGVAPLTVNFNASQSNDPNGPPSTNPLTYSWNFGDATAAAAGVSVAHVFIAAGPYTVTLTVTDITAKTSTARQRRSLPLR